MSDIAINNDESQNTYQKTTPVKKSSNKQIRPDTVLANAILQIWQGWPDSNRQDHFWRVAV